MRIIKQRTTIPVPQVFDFELSADQAFGYRYVFMEYIHTTVARRCGEDADVDNHHQPIEIDHTHGLALFARAPGHFTRILLQMQQQAENREAMSMNPDDPDWLTACWVLKTALTHMIIEDRVRGPFPLCHLDLQFWQRAF